MKSRWPPTPTSDKAECAHLDHIGQSGEELVPKERWENRDGFVWVHGLGYVLGSAGELRVKVRTTHDLTCQTCKRETRPAGPVVLWRRYEHILRRRMYWFSLAPAHVFQVPCRSFPDESDP